MIVVMVCISLMVYVLSVWMVAKNVKIEIIVMNVRLDIFIMECVLIIALLILYLQSLIAKMFVDNVHKDVLIAAQSLIVSFVEAITYWRTEHARKKNNVKLESI